MVLYSGNGLRCRLLNFSLRYDGLVGSCSDLDDFQKQLRISGLMISTISIPQVGGGAGYKILMSKTRDVLYDDVIRDIGETHPAGAGSD